MFPFIAYLYMRLPCGIYATLATETNLPATSLEPPDIKLPFSGRSAGWLDISGL